MYTKYNYNNVIYPHIAFGCNVASFSSVKAQVGPLFLRAELAWNF